MKSSSFLVFLIWYLIAISAANLSNVTLIACNMDNLKKEYLRDAKELYVLHCNIPTLQNAVFLRHNKLETLFISESKLSKLEDYSLNGLMRLTSLDLTRNNISQIKSWSDEDLINVIALDLRRNCIKKLEIDSFRRFPNLQKLNLAVNLIEIIPDGMLRSMPLLKYINIGKNHLKQIDLSTFRGLHKLSHLALHYNQINEVNPQAFDTNNNLRSVRLEANAIVDLKFMAQMNLGRLVHLNLSNNAIDSLKRMAFTKDTELKSLDVSYNLIGEIYEDTLLGLDSLEMLNASHNRIHTIASKSFLELTSLTHLDISANNLTNLPLDIFNSTHRLKYINMSDNALEHLESNHFHEMSQLQLLDLSINHLHRDNFIEGLFSQCRHHHRQRKPQMHALHLLNLSYNEYSVINLSKLYEFERVDLSGNLWDCNWLIREIIHGPDTIRFGRNYMMKNTEGDPLSVAGVDCYDEKTKRSIILIYGSNLMDSKDGENSISSLLFCSNIRSNHQLDNKDIAICILLLVILGFVAVQILRAILLQFTCKSKRRIKQSSNREEDVEKIEMMSCGDTAISTESNVDKKNIQ